MAGPDTGVYVTLEELIRIRYRARGLSFLPRQPVHSLLDGRHASRMRGRGFDFEEIREYQPGDDVRTIDWKVTARTGEAHVRVYTEERDRPSAPSAASASPRSTWTSTTRRPWSTGRCGARTP